MIRQKRCRACLLLGESAALVLMLAGVAVGEAPKELPVEAQSAAPIAPVDPLLTQVDQAIDVTSRRYLDANVHTPWQIIHAYLGLRDRFLLKLNGEKVDGL